MNPFDEDSDRYQIWEMLVDRDIAAFVAGDWSQVARDFVAEGFMGIRGAAHPDDWRIAFPTLDDYRDEWLRQSSAFSRLSFVGESGAQLLHRATRLQDIEITGRRAIAHKKFKAVATTTTGTDYSLDWQTLYWLKMTEQGWKIIGFVGYLPHPFPAAQAGELIAAPSLATQHTTAGPYSPVLRVRPGVIVAVSGQGPIDAQGQIVGAGIAAQARHTLDNCVRQLAVAGATMNDVFQVRVYLSDMADWAAFNEVYLSYVKAPFPVRTAIEARLWGGILVEVDMLANV